MAKQIVRLSPHQNGKVFGVLMALGSLVFLIPFALLFSFAVPDVDPQGNPVPKLPLAMFLLAPVLYLIIGYISTAISCAIYNTMVKYIGGIEYDSQ